MVMPPTASRPHPVDLLLCGHHFRVSQASLQAAGADVYDKDGLLIMAGTRTASTERFIIGGHQDTIPQFLGVLPAGLRDQSAGCFIADPHTLTPAKVRDLADRVIRDWRNLQDQRIAAEFLRQPPAGGP